MALPHIAKSDIRPAYQKTKQAIPAGRNKITQSGETDGLAGYTNEDNFIYFYVDTTVDEYSESEVTQNNDVSLIRVIPVTVYCYGADSASNALMLKALLRSIQIQHFMNFNGYYQYSEGRITPLMEDINGEWWERNDVTFTLTNKVDLETEKEDRPVLSSDADITVYVDGGKRL